LEPEINKWRDWRAGNMGEFLLSMVDIDHLTRQVNLQRDRTGVALRLAS
jgi:hypothetical protein